MEVNVELVFVSAGIVVMGLALAAVIVKSVEWAAGQSVPRLKSSSGNSDPFAHMPVDLRNEVINDLERWGMIPSRRIRPQALMPNNNPADLPRG